MNGKSKSIGKKRQIKEKQFRHLIFHDFQKRDKYCDVTVYSADGATSVKAHRVILAATMNHLNDSMLDSESLQTDMDDNMLRKVIDFCYTNEVSFENVAEMSSMAEFATRYGITDLIEKCEEYSRLSIAPSIAPLIEPSIAPSPPPSPPENLIIFGSWGKRMCFDMAVLSSMDADWIQMNEIKETEDYKRQLTSIAYCGNDCVIVSGGLKCEESLRLVTLVDLANRTVESLLPMKTPRCEHASVVHNNFLYVAGGMNAGDHLNSVEKFDMKRRRWSSKRCMRETRTLFAMIVANDLIYAIGGEDGYTCLRSVEYFHPTYNTWTLTTPMIKPRANPGVAVLNNAIYVIGGSMLMKYGQTNTVERYDLNTKQWSLIATMNVSREHVACGVFQNSLIAAGGYDFASYAIDNVERYDAETDQWIPMKKLNEMRGHCLLFVSSTQFSATHMH